VDVDAEPDVTDFIGAAVDAVVELEEGASASVSASSSASPAYEV